MIGTIVLIGGWLVVTGCTIRKKKLKELIKNKRVRGSNIKNIEIEKVKSIQNHMDEYVFDLDDDMYDDANDDGIVSFETEVDEWMYNILYGIMNSKEEYPENRSYYLEKENKRREILYSDNIFEIPDDLDMNLKIQNIAL